MDVETQSGVNIGKVKDIIMDIDGQIIVQYEVGSLLGKDLLISRDQIMRFEKDKLIVDDVVYREIDENLVKQSSPESNPIMMSERQ